MKTLGLELNDARLNSVDIAGGTCRITFRPAYLHELDVESGDTVGPCMEVDVEFIFDCGAIEGALGDLPASILRCSLDVAAETMPRLIPVPFNSATTVALKLLMWPDYREIIISANAITIRLDRGPHADKSTHSS